MQTFVSFSGYLRAFTLVLVQRHLLLLMTISLMEFTANVKMTPMLPYVVLTWTLVHALKVQGRLHVCISIVLNLLMDIFIFKLMFYTKYNV